VTGIGPRQPSSQIIRFKGSTSLIQLVINGHPRQFETSSMTVSELVEQLGLTGKRLAIERNGEIVTRSTFAQTVLNDGDKLEIVGAVGGG
jgi:sulfur carrier protein